MGLEPGTTKAAGPPLPGKLEQGRQRHPRSLAAPIASSPAPAGSFRPCILHAPGSLCTYEPQWGSDVFGMYQSLVEGREVPWALLVKDMPKKQSPRPRFHRRATRLGRQHRPEISRTTTTSNPSPSPTRASEGYVDRWIVYGKVDGEQLFTAKELTVEPGAKCTIKDNGAYGLITVQGKGRMNRLDARLPETHPLPRTDRGRSVLHRSRRQGRRDLRKHQRRRAAGRPALLRPRSKPERPGDGRLQEE